MKKGFLDWLHDTDADVVSLQETKLQLDQVPEEILKHSQYRSYWHSAEKKGYSGVATLSKYEPLSVTEMGIDEFDQEGRFQALEYDSFVLINAYFPNSQAERARLKYKLAFCDALYEKAEEWKSKGKGVVICGDYNIAHQPIDLKRPKQNEDNPGYYIEECEWMTSFLQKGYVDFFREQHLDEPDHYSWWSYRAQARSRNVGWRIDYHCVNQEFMDHVDEARICPEVMGSDHCPVMLTLK